MVVVGKSKARNPNWGRYAEIGVLHGVRVTAFEKKVAELGIDPDDTNAMKSSRKLRQWAQEHRNHRYIPEQLLAAWDIMVNLTDTSLRAMNL